MENNNNNNSSNSLVFGRWPQTKMRARNFGHFVFVCLLCSSRLLPPVTATGNQTSLEEIPQRGVVVVVVAVVAALALAVAGAAAVVVAVAVTVAVVVVDNDVGLGF